MLPGRNFFHLLLVDDSRWQYEGGGRRCSLGSTLGRETTTHLGANDTRRHGTAAPPIHGCSNPSRYVLANHDATSERELSQHPILVVYFGRATHPATWKRSKTLHTNLLDVAKHNVWPIEKRCLLVFDHGCAVKGALELDERVLRLALHTPYLQHIYAMNDSHYVEKSYHLTDSRLHINHMIERLRVSSI